MSFDDLLRPTTRKDERPRIQARHAAQPRGLARLMSDPAARVHLAAAAGCVVGFTAMWLVAMALGVAL